MIGQGFPPATSEGNPAAERSLRARYKPSLAFAFAPRDEMRDGRRGPFEAQGPLAPDHCYETSRAVVAQAMIRWSGAPPQPVAEISPSGPPSGL